MKESHIKQLRKNKGLTQVQIAMQAQISVRNYQRIEAGKSQPKVRTARQIASVLDTTVEELFSVN